MALRLLLSAPVLLPRGYRLHVKDEAQGTQTLAQEELIMMQRGQESSGLDSQCMIPLKDKIDFVFSILKNFTGKYCLYNVLFSV